MTTHRDLFHGKWRYIKPLKNLDDDLEVWGNKQGDELIYDSLNEKIITVVKKEEQRKKK